MKTAIVILNWNGIHFLEKFLPKLIEKTQLDDVEIIVADNASTDNSMEMMASKFHDIRTLVFDKNYGFAGGYNKALAQIDTEYYVLLNSDVEVADNWLQPLHQFMDNNPNYAACQPKILSYSEPTKFEHAGAAGGFLDAYGYPFCRGRIFNQVEIDEGQYNTVTDIFWATGACLFIRSQIFWKVGGLDDEFFAHMEEIDLCWRINNRGYKIACVPESVVFHVGGGTLNAEHPRKTYLNFRNNLLMLYKNLGNKSLKEVLRYRFVLDYLAVFQFFVGGKTKNAKSVIQARKDYKKMIPSFLEKRNENLLYTTINNQSLLYNRSIVYQFFVNKKKKFSDLDHSELKIS